MTPYLVPIILGGLAVLVMAVVSMIAARKGKHPSPVHAPTPTMALSAARILIHSINDDRCVGCDACVAVCPTNVLDLVNNKSRVLRFQDCIQCEACMWACPTEALVMHPEGTEPKKLKAPELDEFFQTAVQGQYLIGEVAGKPLVKNAANLGRMVVEHMLREGLRPNPPGPDGMFDVAIIGSGPGGLSAALTCIRHGLSYVVLEKEQMIASTVSRYPKGKFVMAEPYDVRNLSFLPVFDSTKEQMVQIWQQVINEAKVNIKMGEPVESVTKQPDGTFDIRTIVASYKARRVVLGIGTRGKPRTLGVPGENLPKIQTLLENPDDFRGKAVMVTGGGDSAVEASMALADAGARVLVSYRGRSFNRAQAKNKTAIESYEAQKRVKILYQSQVVQFTEDTVTLQLPDGQQKTYPNEATFVLIGADPPIKWLEKVGVQFVERPHSYALGKTDELVLRMAGDNVLDCPEDAAAAAYLAREGRLPDNAAPPTRVPTQHHEDMMNKTMIQGFEPASGPRKWLKTFTSAFRIDQPMPLSEFAGRKSQRIHVGNGRRDALPAAERTRMLRMLRDEGGRLADEDTRALDVEAIAPPAPPMFQQHMAPRPAAPAAPTQIAYGSPLAQSYPGQQPYGQMPVQSAAPAAPTQIAYGSPVSQSYSGQYPPAPAKPSAPTHVAYGAPVSQSYSGQQLQPVPQQPAQAAAWAGQAGQQANASWGGAGNPAPMASAQPAVPAAPQQASSGAWNAQQKQAGARAFDEEPTRQVDGDAALAALLNEPTSPGLGGSKPQPHHQVQAQEQDDAAATQALYRYSDPLAAHDAEEPTRIGHLGEMRSSRSQDVEEPTRAVDMNNWLNRRGGGESASSGYSQPGSVGPTAANLRRPAAGQPAAPQPPQRRPGPPRK